MCTFRLTSDTKFAIVALNMRPEECIVGLRVVIASRSKHLGKYATVVKQTSRRIHVVFDGETRIRWYSASNLKRIQAGTTLTSESRGSQPDSATVSLGLQAPSHPHLNPVERRTVRPTVVIEEPPHTSIIPTVEGSSNHALLESLRINHAYDHDNDFNNVVDNLVDTLLSMNLGSTVPVLEFIRDKIETAELLEIDRHSP